MKTQMSDVASFWCQDTPKFRALRDYGLLALSKVAQSVRAIFPTVAQAPARRVRASCTDVCCEMRKANFRIPCKFQEYVIAFSTAQRMSAKLLYHSAMCFSAELFLVSLKTIQPDRLLMRGFW